MACSTLVIFSKGCVFMIVSFHLCLTGLPPLLFPLAFDHCCDKRLATRVNGRYSTFSNVILLLAHLPSLSSHPPLLPFSFYTKYNRKSQQWQSTRQYYRCEIYHLASWKVLYEPYLPRRRLFIMNYLPYIRLRPPNGSSYKALFWGKYQPAYRLHERAVADFRMVE